MILADQDIRDALNFHALKIAPFEPQNLQPASVDLTLDNMFTELTGYSSIYADMPRAGTTEHPDGYKHTTVSDGEYFDLRPGRFVLASTVEHVTIPDFLVGEVRDKSSVARLGLSLLPAGYIDPGFRGHITLEIVNHTRHVWCLKPGMLICQILFYRMHNKPIHAYGAAHGSRYQDQPRGPVTSRIYERH